MFCRQCGKQIADDSKFCTSCGWKVAGAATPVVKPETAKTQEAKAIVPAEQPKATAVQAKEKGKKGVLWGVIIGLLVLLAGCIVVVVCLMGKLNEEDDDKKDKDKKKDRTEEVIEDSDDDKEEISFGEEAERAEAVDPVENKQKDIANVGCIMDAIEIVAVDPAINWSYVDDPIYVELSENGCMYSGGDEWGEAITQLDRIIPATSFGLHGDWENSLSFTAFKLNTGRVCFVRDVEELEDIEAVSEAIVRRFTTWEEASNILENMEGNDSTTSVGGSVTDDV